jgi:hypothetical protein
MLLLLLLLLSSAMLLFLHQVRQFKPKMVAIRDASKVKQLQELIKDVSPQPEILVGDEGAVEVSNMTCNNLSHGVQRAAQWNKNVGGSATPPGKLRVPCQQLLHPA